VGEHSVLLGQALAHRSAGAAETALDLARSRDRQPEVLAACLVLAEVTDDPRGPLHEAYQLAERFGASPLRRHVLDRIRERGLSRPPTQPRTVLFSPVEQRVIAMIRRGYTNRQIASTLRVRQKTAENYLTRLLAKTGTRSRVELIAASLAHPRELNDRSA
jgi:DNA-binding NarL/FixJ family response regulator